MWGRGWKSTPSLPGVYFRYRRRGPWVLENVTFEAKPGERVLVIGPNGSGKTTVLKIAVGAYAPAAGTVSIGGYQPRRLPGSVGRLVSVAVDPPSLPPATTVGAYLDAAAARGCNDLDYTIAEALGLKRLLGEPVSRLSQGYRRRLAIDAASQCRPGLVLLDEPLSGVDFESAATIAGLLEDLKDSTLIVASHAYLDIGWSKVVALVGGRASVLSPSDAEVAEVAGKCGGSELISTYTLADLARRAFPECKVTRAQCLDPIASMLRRAKR